MPSASRSRRSRDGSETARVPHARLDDVYRHRADATTLTRVSSQDEVGLARFYRAVSIGGNDPSLPEAVSLHEPGSKPQPCAPVPIRGIRNGAGDLTVTWIRWARVSGEGRDLVDVPLNEAKGVRTRCAGRDRAGGPRAQHRGNISRLFGHSSDHRLRRVPQRHRCCSPRGPRCTTGRSAAAMPAPPQGQ